MMRLKDYLLLSFFPAWIALHVPATHAATINVNNVCKSGDCAGPDVLASGANTNLPFDFVYQFANTDRYQVTGTTGAQNNIDSSGIIEIDSANLRLTYLGNSSGTASAADTLVIDFIQSFATPTAEGATGTGFEYVSGSFGGPLANASSVTAQGFSNNGTSQALMGPFFPPNDFEDSRDNQPASFASVSLLDFRDTILFGDSSGVGSTISVNNVPIPASAPEPATILPAILGLFLIARSVAKRQWRIRCIESRDAS